MSKQWQVGQTLEQAPQPLQRTPSAASSGSSKCVSIQSRTEAASISRFAGDPGTGRGALFRGLPAAVRRAVGPSPAANRCRMRGGEGCPFSLVASNK